MSKRFDGFNSRTRKEIVLAGLAWLGAVALGGSFVLGCGENPLPPVIPVDAQRMAISTAGQIRIYDDVAELAVTGPALVPDQIIAAAHVLSVAFDQAGNLYYLANNGTAGSNASFNVCTLPGTGLPFNPCTTVGGAIAGGQWLTINAAGTVFATSLDATTGSVLSFPTAIGPSLTTTVVYTSATRPDAYGGIAVERSSNTLYLTEQASASSFAHQLFQCTSSCQSGGSAAQDLSASITGGLIGGPLATNADPTKLFVGAANANPLAPLTLPISFVCTAATGSLGCASRSASFPGLFGVDNPFQTSVGIAARDNNEVYNAVQVYDGNDPGVVLDPLFFGFQPVGLPFACSGTPSTCPVNRLPSVPVHMSASSVPGSPPYGLALSPQF